LPIPELAGEDKVASLVPIFHALPKRQTGCLRRDAVRQRVFGIVAQALVPAAPGLFPALGL